MKSSFLTIEDITYYKRNHLTEIVFIQKHIRSYQARKKLRELRRRQKKREETQKMIFFEHKMQNRISMDYQKQYEMEKKRLHRKRYPELDKEYLEAKRLAKIGYLQRKPLIRSQYDCYLKGPIQFFREKVYSQKYQFNKIFS